MSHIHRCVYLYAWKKKKLLAKKLQFSADGISSVWYTTGYATTIWLHCHLLFLIFLHGSCHLLHGAQPTTSSSFSRHVVFSRLFRVLLCFVSYYSYFSLHHSSWELYLLHSAWLTVSTPYWWPFVFPCSLSLLFSCVYCDTLPTHYDTPAFRRDSANCGTFRVDQTSLIQPRAHLSNGAFKDRPNT